MNIFKCLSRGSTWAMMILAAGTSLQTQAQGPRSSLSDDFHDKLVQLGSGPEGGSFDPIAKTLCDTLNEARKKTLVRCVPRRTAGSVFNIHAVANGSLQIGLAQEDLLEDAIRNVDGLDEKSLRAVAPMHNSFLGIMVRRSSGITDLSQIARGVVNKGQRGSGTYVYASAVLKALNLEERDLAGVTFLVNNDFEREFCNGKVDVFFNVLAHPSELYRRLRACGGEFLDVPEEIMQKMMAQNVWLKQMDIPAGIYDAEQKQVKTLGMRNLLIANSDVDEEAIFRLTSLILEKHKTMQAKQPYLASMRIMRQGEIKSLAIPLHQGALRAIDRLNP